MIKRILSVFLVCLLAVFVFNPKDVEALCACKLENQQKVMTESNCASGEEARMYTDTTAVDGCRCSCEKIGSQKRIEVYCTDMSAINTALGCIPVDAKKFVTWLLPILFGIAGGIAFILMIYGFILVATSSGDEKKIQAAKETITSAITGLLLSIFAIFIVRLIAVNILKIPGI